MKCSVCKQKGHNKQTCKTITTPKTEEKKTDTKKIDTKKTDIKTEEKKTEEKKTDIKIIPSVNIEINTLPTMD